jgi:hypothetical protein
MSDVRSNNTIGPTWNFMEAFEEAKIDLGNNSAEFKALGTVTLSTKRGGNQMHGSVYDYYGTGAFRARDYFTGARSGTPSHGFGGFVSGPVVLPKVYNGRDKTFWFVSYETTFAPQGVDNLTPSVPLPAWKRGDFSGERGLVLRDPLASNQPFANNTIPPGRISNVARQYLPLWPDPNFGDSNVFTNLNYREQKRRPFDKAHNVQTRVDHRISSANTIVGRYLYQQQDNPGFESGLPGTLGIKNQLRVVRHAVVSDTHIFSPTLINEFRFGLSYNTNPRWAEDVDGPAFVKATGLQRHAKWKTTVRSPSPHCPVRTGSGDSVHRGHPGAVFQRGPYLPVAEHGQQNHRQAQPAVRGRDQPETLQRSEPVHGFVRQFPIHEPIHRFEFRGLPARRSHYGQPRTLRRSTAGPLRRLRLFPSR